MSNIQPLSEKQILFCLRNMQYKLVLEQYEINPQLITHLCIESIKKEKTESGFFNWIYPSYRNPIMPFEIFKSIIDLDLFSLGLLNSFLCTYPHQKENNQATLYILEKYSNHFHWFSEKESSNIIEDEYNIFNLFIHVFNKNNFSLLDYAIKNLPKEKMMHAIKDNELKNINIDASHETNVLINIMENKYITTSDYYYNENNHLEKLKLFLELKGNLNQVLCYCKRLRDLNTYEFYIISPLDLAIETKNQPVIDFLSSHRNYNMLRFNHLIGKLDRENRSQYLSILGDDLRQMKKTYEEKYSFDKMSSLNEKTKENTNNLAKIKL
jgi:hypothetical protein